MATVLIQCRRGTESEWAASNPILAAGEFGYTSDTGKTKIGNGASQWSALPYATTDLATLATQAALDSLQSQLTDVIGDAPAALDTIHELADALADNADVLSLYATQANLDATDALVALNATQANLDATDALVALNATQVSLDATDALVALNTTQVAHDADKASLDADIATKADTDDPTFTTGITTPKIDVQSNGTIQGKDIVGNDSLRLRTIGNSDLSIEPAGTGIVQISTDVNLATGKEFKVNGVAIGGGGGGATWETKTASFSVTAGTSYFVNTSAVAITATLPSAPTQGDEVRFLDVTGDFDTNNLTVDPDGGSIIGLASDLIVNTERAGFALVYYDATQGWVLKDK
jgi:hypothetical protein